MIYQMPQPPEVTGITEPQAYIRLMFGWSWEGIFTPRKNEERVIHASVLSWRAPFTGESPQPFFSQKLLVYHDRTLFDSSPVGKVILLGLDKPTDIHHLRVRVLDLWPLNRSPREEGRRIRKLLASTD